MKPLPLEMQQALVDAALSPLRVLTPSMPTADELLPLLRRIDAARVYVNNGPLLRELEARCQRLFGAPMVAVSNGTLAIELALRALDLPPGAGVIVPAVTYVATALAVVNAGLRPVVVDVEPRTWRLDAAYAREIARERPDVAAVIPVAAYGAPVPVEPWEALAETTGLAVVVDAAGCLLQQRASDRLTTCYSLHATKAVGAGEGGLVASASDALRARVADLACFGRGGTNAKMSEYHAAVALASLDLGRLEAKRVHSFMLEAAYVEHLPRSCALQSGAMQTHRTLFPVLLPPRAPRAAQVEQRLASEGIESKRWYRPFLSERGEFFECREGAFAVTDALAAHMLGLPFHGLMQEADVARVCAALERAIAS